MRAALGRVAKAVTGGIVAGLGAGATAAADDVVTVGEWWAIAAATAAAAWAVWRMPNAAPAEDTPTQLDDALEDSAP